MERAYSLLYRNSSSYVARNLVSRLSQSSSVLRIGNFDLKCHTQRNNRLFHSSTTLFCPKKDPEQPSIISSSSKQTWITNFPVWMQPYMRLARMDKPIGTWLLFLPCSWGTALATAPHTIPDPILLLKFLTGAFIMRGAGCTINDLWDRDLDKKVARTQSRPLASGEITPKQALGFLSLQLLSGLGILVTFNYSVIQVGLMSMPLVIAYPLMKRVTYWPQFVLGLTFNWGTWVGWAAVQDSVSFMHVLPLYTAGVCWTLVYDSLYAYQDREDDVKVGIKSVPVLLGDHPQWPLTGFSLGMLTSLFTAGYIGDLGSAYYAGTTAAWLHSVWQIWSADLQQPANLDARFRANLLTGGLVFMSVVAGKCL